MLYYVINCHKMTVRWKIEMKLFENKLQHYPHSYINDVELEIILEGTPNSRYSKIKRMAAQGKLLRIRRGLYYITHKLGQSERPHPFELAQYIYGPSYISLESALSFHQLIPETVYTITNVTSKRSKTFNTSLGIFSYLHMPVKNLYVQVELITEQNNYQFLIAKPWKAICDYVFCYKKKWNSIYPLIESLRINPNSLPILRTEEIELLNEYYQQAQIKRFLKGVQKNLNCY